MRKREKALFFPRWRLAGERRLPPSRSDRETLFFLTVANRARLTYNLRWINLSVDLAVTTQFEIGEKEPPSITGGSHRPRLTICVSSERATSYLCMLKLIEDSHEILIRHCGRVAKESVTLIQRINIIRLRLCICAVSLFFQRYVRGTLVWQR